jgi:hypothetical protein
MIGLLIVACAGVVIGFVAGLSAGLWTCGKDEQTG